MLQIYALIIVETGDFVCAIGESLNDAIETACSALDLQPGDLEPYDMSESLATDMLAEQYGGASICTSTAGLTLHLQLIHAILYGSMGR